MAHSTPDRVRVVSPGGHFLRTCTHKEATRLIQQKLARIQRANRVRIRSIIDLGATVDADIPRNTLVTVVREQLRDTLGVYVSKRLTPDGRFVAWDPGLTMAELKAGKFQSEATRVKRLEEKAFRAS